MPIYLHLANLIIEKKTIEAKYKGGIEQFKAVFFKDKDTFNQEDNEVFSLSSMNIDEFDIEELIEHGLHFDEEAQHSNDFAIKARYGKPLWQTDWLQYNEVFAWHKDASLKEFQRVNEISNMTMDKIIELSEKGIEVRKAIWINK